MINQYRKRLEKFRSDFMIHPIRNVPLDQSKDEREDSTNTVATRFKRHQKDHILSPMEVDRQLSQAYAKELSSFVDEIAASGLDPLAVLERLTQLYETDEVVLEETSDEEGLVAEVYIRDAKDLFVKHALSCQDKEKVTVLVMRIIISDKYGVRSSIVENVHTFLGKKEIRIMIEVLQHLIGKEDDHQAQYNYLYMINSFARQLEDIELFDTTLAEMKNQFAAQFEEYI